MNGRSLTPAAAAAAAATSLVMIDASALRSFTTRPCRRQQLIDSMQAKSERVEPSTPSRDFTRVTPRCSQLRVGSGSWVLCAPWWLDLQRAMGRDVEVVTIDSWTTFKTRRVAARRPCACRSKKEDTAPKWISDGDHCLVIVTGNLSIHGAAR